MNGNTMNSFPLVQSMGSQDANTVKEVNYSQTYFWMDNGKGRTVPVPPHLVQEKLKKGYTHTDKKLLSDDPRDDVRENLPPVETDPLRAMAKVVEKLAEQNESNMEILEEVTGVKRKGRKAKTVEEEKKE